MHVSAAAGASLSANTTWGALRGLETLSQLIDWRAADLPEHSAAAVRTANNNNKQNRALSNPHQRGAFPRPWRCAQHSTRPPVAPAACRHPRGSCSSARL